MRLLTPGQWALRVMCVLGLLVALLATGLAGVRPDLWLIVLVGALALMYAVAPESAAGTVAMAFVLFWWGLALRDGLHPAALLAALGLVTAHLAGLLATYGPARMAVDPATVLLWLRRGAQVLLFSLVLYGVAVLVRDQPEPDGLWLAGLAAGLVTVVLLAVSFAPRGRS